MLVNRSPVAMRTCYTLESSPPTYLDALASPGHGRLTCPESRPAKERVALFNFDCKSGKKGNRKWKEEPTHSKKKVDFLECRKTQQKRSAKRTSQTLKRSPNLQQKPPRLHLCVHRHVRRPWGGVGGGCGNDTTWAFGLPNELAGSDHHVSRFSLIFSPISLKHNNSFCFGDPTQKNGWVFHVGFQTLG